MYSEVRTRSGWAIFMGIVTAALGVFLVLYPLITATLTTVLLAWALILVGLFQLIFALHSQKVGQFFWRVLSSLLYGVCGIMLALHPLAGVEALTVTLGALLLIQSVLQIVTAFRLRPLGGWGWFLFDAAVALLLGVLILAKWPSSSVWAIGTLVGISVFVSGIARIMVAAKIRRGATRINEFFHGTT